MSESKPFPGNPGALQLTVDEAIAEGMYSNFQVVGSSETEFILDFAFIQPTPRGPGDAGGAPRGRVRSRIILHPKQAKSLLRVLGQRLADHERRYGTIPLQEGVLVPGSGGGLPN